MLNSATQATYVHAFTRPITVDTIKMLCKLSSGSAIK